MIDYCTLHSILLLYLVLLYLVLLYLVMLCIAMVLDLASTL